MEEKKLIQSDFKGRCLTQGERVEQMTPLLLEWFQRQARVLPWRTEPKPYYVWISEIMLQQTRVEAVKPYFSRFIRTLPDIPALAECEEELLLKLWEGLGYYNRVRNLQKAAQVVMELYQGELPADYEALLRLPGVGSYTAGAIASIAYQIPVPAVDGNVLRVMARLTESYEDIAKASVKKQTEELLKKYMPKQEARAFNQAMMEIGAMVCLPNGEPKCMECPVRSFCLAFERQVVMELPVKTKKKARRVEEMTVFVIRLAEEVEERMHSTDFLGEEKSMQKTSMQRTSMENSIQNTSMQKTSMQENFIQENSVREKVVLRKRPDSGLLAGMYEFPNVPEKLDLEAAQSVLGSWGVKIQSILPIEEVKHIFSHVEWHMRGYLVEAVRNWDGEGANDFGKSFEQSLEQVGMVAERGTFRIEQVGDGLEWFSVDQVRAEIAIPSAFGGFLKYMERVREYES